MLSDCTYANTPRFTIEGKYDAKIVKVYDGDTITAVFKYNEVFVKFCVRLYGFDAPEMHSKNTAEQKAAVEAKKVLVGLISDKVVQLDCCGFDKYGRLLAVVFLESININKIMVEKYKCHNYNGGTKESW